MTDRRTILIAGMGTSPAVLRKKLRFAGFVNAETFVPQRGNPMTFPMGKVGWRIAKDVCGYPKWRFVAGSEV